MEQQKTMQEKAEKEKLGEEDGEKERKEERKLMEKMKNIRENALKAFKDRETLSFEEQVDFLENLKLADWQKWMAINNFLRSGKFLLLLQCNEDLKAHLGSLKSAQEEFSRLLKLSGYFSELQKNVPQK